MENLYFTIWDSPIGRLLLAASEKGLVRLEFRSPKQKLPPSEGTTQWLKSADKLEPYRREVEEYLAGRLRKFTLPLDMRGTPFQKRCWQALLEIPYGEVRTYAEMARAVGHPRAFRAVGGANHDNPIAIVVPCHRVIASDGTLGGYGGGLPLKEKLLRLEGALVQGRLGL